MEVAHPLDVDKVFYRVFTNLLRSPECSFSQDVAQSLPFGDTMYHLNQGLIITEPEVKSVGILASKDSLFVKLHGPGNHAARFQIINTVVVNQVIAYQDSKGRPATGFSGKGTLEMKYESFKAGKLSKKVELKN